MAASHCFEAMRAWSSLQGGEGGEVAMAGTSSSGNSLISGNRRRMVDLSSAMVDGVALVKNEK
jgi:hypothetical protein